MIFQSVTTLIAIFPFPRSLAFLVFFRVNFATEPLLKQATMHTKNSLRLSFSLLLLLAVETVADADDTDFLMNVFSDLGP